MQALTTQTEKAVSVSGVVLIGISLIISSGIVLLLLTMIQWQSWNSFFDLMAVAILGIGIYYVSFGAIGFAFTKKAKKVAAATA